MPGSKRAGMRMTMAALAVLLGVIPASAQVLEAAPSPPLKPPAVLNDEQLLKKYVVSTLGGPGALSATLASALDQWQRSPPEWGTASEGYAKRWASSYAEAAIGSTTKYAVARLLRHDPSFTRCQCTGVGPRLRHALISPFTARTRRGRRVLSPAILAGLAAESLVPAATWYPAPHGTVGGLGHTAVSVVAKMGVDVFREFVQVRRRK